MSYLISNMSKKVLLEGILYALIFIAALLQLVVTFPVESTVGFAASLVAVLAVMVRETKFKPPYNYQGDNF